jgi:small subunit ribosomal protein S8
MGTSIVSTPKGVMSGRAARKAHIGGELLCEVW